MCMVIASSAGCGGKKAEEVAKNEIKIDSEKADMEKAEEMAAAEHPERMRLSTLSRTVTAQAKRSSANGLRILREPQQ